ncbi:hypothetical protein A4X09_0g312 [Tilletia walkeri]|uniref:Glucose-methanol-choline oxidoreductase N-terminal domain-containing protein n=1 Tax=Tilletia walkeri TaxID=117179 RepID=A0A8X7T7U9_9BASI|nr:hypothetical protein A4X09_0g312 [Tilletia walkeri]
MTATSTKPDTRMHGQAVAEPVSVLPSPTGTTSHSPSARDRLARLAAHLLPSRFTSDSPPDFAEYDYVIVGGGTAGAVLADRLTEDANVNVAVIEGGPSDIGNDAVLDLRRWMELLGSELDYDYATTEQPMGNSHIKHSRAKVLGGCSSHNTLISFRPLKEDLDGWANDHGCPSWSARTIQPYGDRLKLNTVPVAPQHRNHVVRDWVQAASHATGAPVLEDMNSHIVHGNRSKPFQQGVGFFNISYDPNTGQRSSASVAYLHPIMPGGPRARPNLHLFLETWASKLDLETNETDGRLRAKGVHVKDKQGHSFTLKAKHDVILCAGAIDTPRLLLLSGIGPRAELQQLGIKVQADVPGVGENLQDHPESIIMWETRDTPAETVMSSDAGLFLRILPQRGEPGSNKLPSEPTSHPGPDMMAHIYQVPWAEHTGRLGFDVPAHAICMTPNISRSQGRGKLSLRSADAQDKPLLDFRYFEDEQGYDAHILVEGIKIARKIAKEPCFARHLLREVAPGPKIQSDADLSAYARSVAHTVYHPCGTCKMGSTATDPLAVVDEADMRVRGCSNLRVIDASVFPAITSVNPMLTVLQVAEAGAERIRNEVWKARWAREAAARVMLQPNSGIGREEQQVQLRQQQELEEQRRRSKQSDKRRSVGANETSVSLMSASDLARRARG